MSSYNRRPSSDTSNYWEQADAEARALATLFPDWPGREEDVPDWLNSAPTPKPDLAPPEPLPRPEPTFEPPFVSRLPIIDRPRTEAAAISSPTPVSPPVREEPIYPTHPRTAPKATSRDHLYAPIPQITTASSYLKPLTHKHDNTAVWTHITPQSDLPFTVQTIYTLSAIPAHWSPRGFAHRNAWVAIQLLQGGFNMVIDDGEKTSTLALYSTDQLLLLPPLIWRRFVNVLDDTLLLCLSSHPVAEAPSDDMTDDAGSEWVTQYADFLSLRHAQALA